jgi:hypothetical protein
MTTYILILDDGHQILDDGHQEYFGPFDSVLDADAFAEDFNDKGIWSIEELHSPTQPPSQHCYAPGTAPVPAPPLPPTPDNQQGDPMSGRPLLWLLIFVFSMGMTLGVLLAGR